jgi:amino acid transporter/nucleotide-binding universal stress UspA family protein
VPLSQEPSISTVSSRATKIVVASTVLLSFITFWRAAAIVLCDLASSAFYAGGITEGFVGKSAPWFVLAIMLFSYSVRAVYVESCAMFVRGGVYRVVREALGPMAAKFAVSALLFDYVLTGPISGVTAGLYLAGLINDLAAAWKRPDLAVHPELFACLFTIAVTAYFWRKNVIGMHESSTKALRIMQLTTVMAVTLIVWAGITIVLKGYQPVPFPSPSNIVFANGALGWLEGTFWPSISGIVVLVGLGHALLAMSGEESLAQVHREIAAPKIRNLERAGRVIFLYSMLFTSFVSFLSVMLIPDSERMSRYAGNLISGLAMHLSGPLELRLAFQMFVVVVGAVILSGAINTSIIGCNGVINRVAEDGILPGWFRQPHGRFGTTYRVIGFVVLLQILTVVLSRGNMVELGDAYAFGVVWSFAFMALSMFVLRFKRPEEREWKMPGNFMIAGREIPVGVGLVALFLFTMALINLFTKKTATIWGLSFTILIFAALQWCERRQRRTSAQSNAEEFQLSPAEAVDATALDVRPGAVLVPVRNPFQLDHLRRALDHTDPDKMDIVVMTVRAEAEAEVFDSQVQDLFTRVVHAAEKSGKPVKLLAVSGRDANEAIVETAQRIGAESVVMGLSGKYRSTDAPREQAKSFGDAWEKLPAPRPPLTLEVVDPASESRLYFNLGPHPPRLWPQDLELLHTLWLRLSATNPKLRHRDVVHLALTKLDRELQ